MAPAESALIIRRQICGDKEGKAMEKNLRFLTAVAVVIALAVGAWGVEAQQSMPGMQGPQPAPKDASVEGTVKKFDPAKKSLDVSTGLLGLWSKTLEVTNSTQIQVEGRQATLADIHEGVKVKASYENREGKSFATHIDLLMMMPEPKKAPDQAGATSE
jgi:Cu/Ag efflux protein CusF